MTIKRLFDVCIAALAFVALWPMMVGVALAVRWALGSPVLFRQWRPGLHGVPFQMIKFRTMRDAVDAQGRPLPDQQRLGRFGRFLRSTSLDELPELWNVLRGDMSLVGPRPLLVEYMPLYNPQQARRHEVRPGITGWAQVNGRNAVTWEDKFAMDVWYVDHRDIWLDVRILFVTLAKVIRRSDITSDGHASVEPFRGSGSTEQRVLQ